MASFKAKDAVEDGEEIELQSRLSDADDKEGLLSGEHVQRSKSRFTWALSAAVAALLILISVAFVFRLTNTARITVEDALSIRNNDYTLDPAWPFTTSPRKREFTWTIRDHIHNPDGIYRPMILVNNQFPGPLIEINEGDTVVVHVHNRATNATSIHWHGIYQNGTNHMDGTVGITQCPIAPGGSFTYKFTVKGQSGTYWWHAHQGLQSSDGVHGPLIVHSRDEQRRRREEYDSDRVVLVSDHYHDLSSALLWQYLMPDRENAEPVPDTALLNGRNARNCEDFPQRRCDNTSSHVNHAVLDLKPDRRHRIRFINVGAFAEFQIQIDEHELFVMEVDGTDVQPVGFHRVNISPAQRYSVIVQTPKWKSDSFWMRARMVTQCFTDPPRSLNPEVKAIIRYRPSATIPTSIDWKEQLASDCRDMNTSELRPAQVIAAPSQADAFFYLRSNFEIGAYRLSRGFFNATSFRPDAASPILHRVVDGLTSSNTSFSSQSSASKSWVNSAAFDMNRELVLQTTGIQIIDLLISNFDDGSHPMHLHGYKFFVLASGHGYPPSTTPGEMSLENLAPLYNSLDLTNPLRRDTATVEAFGWILLRFVADNPGAWAFHCHLGWHSEAGLVMQFLTRTELLDHVPKENRGLCKAEGIVRGLGPNDEDYAELA